MSKTKLQKIREQVQKEIEEELASEVVDLDEDILDDTNLKPLNVRQEKFVELYSMTANATQSAIEAGYAESSAPVMGFKLLQMPQIQAAIKRNQIKFRQETKLTREDLINDLIYFLEQSKGEDGSPSDGMKAIEILNKMMGWNFPDKLDVTSRSLSVNYIIPNEDDETK